MWFWDKPDESESWINYKTILFVVACSGFIWATSQLVLSVGDTAEKIDEVISSDESSEDEN